MKKIVITLVLSFIVFGVSSAQKTNPNYDVELAKKLGADDYGMKTYTLVILKTGTNTSTDKSKKAEAFQGHMENINRLVETGQLIVAGPIETNTNNYRGIFILTVSDLAKAETLLNTDPAIKEKYLEAEHYNWYGSAALGEYLPTSDKIWKIGF